MLDTIYRERANGRVQYWVYGDGVTIIVSKAWAMREVAAGRAKIVEVA